MNGESPKDALDALEYPLVYAFKAMCRQSPEVDVVAQIRTVFETVLPADRLTAVRENPSRTGKFKAVTLTATIESRAELESVYHALAADPLVVMTL